jgi:hypothetical protein
MNAADRKPLDHQPQRLGGNGAGMPIEIVQHGPGQTDPASWNVLGRSSPNSTITGSGLVAGKNANRVCHQASKSMVTNREENKLPSQSINRSRVPGKRLGPG